MRLLILTIACAVFVAVFAFVNLVVSVVDGVTDTETTIEAMRAAKTRDALLDYVALAGKQELRKTYELRDIPEAQLRSTLGRVVTQAWFEETSRSLHEAFMRAVHDERDGAVFSTKGVKEKVREGTQTLMQSAGKECAQVFGAAVCAQDTEFKRAKQSFTRQVDMALAEVPERIELFKTLDRPGLRGVRDRLANVSAWKWIGLGIVLVLAGFIFWLGGRQHGLVALGVALLLGCGAYLLAVPSARSSGIKQAEVAIRENIPERRRSKTQAIARDGALTLASELVTASTPRLPLRIGVSLGIGIVLVGAGVWVRKKS